MPPQNRSASISDGGGRLKVHHSGNVMQNLHAAVFQDRERWTGRHISTTASSTVMKESLRCSTRSKEKPRWSTISVGAGRHLGQQQQAGIGDGGEGDVEVLDSRQRLAHRVPHGLAAVDHQPAQLGRHAQQLQVG